MARKPKNLDQPATKGDALRSQEELAQIFARALSAEMKSQDKNLHNEMKTQEKNLRNEVKTWGESLRAEIKELIAAEGAETRRHFDVVYEQLRDELLESSKDAVNLLQNQVPDHEDRIVDLEQHAGLPAGPRYQHLK